jgi:dienelactone hydrolase
VSPVPIRQFHGAADDYVPAAPCRAYYQRLRAAGANAALTEFPDANHVFDNPLAPQTPTVLKGGQSVRACKLKEESVGIIINIETAQPFTYQDSCVQIDPHTGYNKAASVATREAVKELLLTVFKRE